MTLITAVGNFSRLLLVAPVNIGSIAMAWFSSLPPKPNVFIARQHAMNYVSLTNAGTVS